MANDTQAEILYLGHSTVLITTEIGKRIVIDPWLEGNPRCPKDYYQPGNIDYIILTHGHSDHTGSALALAKDTGALVYGAFELIGLLVADGLSQEQARGMNTGGSAILTGGNNLRVSLTHAIHSSSYTSIDGTTHYAGVACGAVVTLESGFTIYHAGDTSLFSDMQLVKENFKPIVSILPIGDNFTMGPEDAAKAASLLGSEYVIPVHYKTFDVLTGTAKEFETALKTCSPEIHSTPVILEPGERFTLKGA